ncbi:MAG: MMPL family transporter [Deltaproteobacteria bacterium]|nr:MMPL family transporter [Deltaproteobacteria bacterium]
MFTLLATLGTAVIASGLTFDSRYEALMPEGDPEIAKTEEVREQTGGVRQLVVAVEGKDPQVRLEFCRRLAESLQKIEEIRYVDLEFPVDFFKDRAGWLMQLDTLDELIPALKEAVRVAKWQANPMHLHLDEEAEKEELEQAWQKVDDIAKKRLDDDMPADGILTSKDGRYTFILVIPAIRIIDIKAGHRMVAKIDAAVTELSPKTQGLNVKFAGTLKIFQEQHATMLKDLRNASILAFVFGVFIVAVFTRRPLGPILIGAALIVGIIWTFALARILIGHVNIITGFLVAVLFGLGIDFGIHLFIRYQQELRQPGATIAKACEAAVKGTFPPALTSALTTAGTFISMYFAADFRGFSEFGLIAGIGVLMTLSSSFLVLPPLLLVLDHRRKIPEASHSPIEIPKRGIGSAAAWGIVVGMGAIAIYGAIHSTKIPFKNDYRLLRGESPATTFFNYVNKSLGAGFNPAVFLTDSVDSAEKIAAIARDMSEVKTPGQKQSLVGKVTSISDLLPTDVEEHRKRVSQLREILSDTKLDRAEKKGGKRAEQLAQARKMAKTEPWSVEDIPSSFSRRLTTLDKEKFVVYVWPKKREDSDLWLTLWEDDLKRLSSKLTEQGIEHEMSDETLVAAWIYRLIVADSGPLFAVAVIVLLFFLAIDFRGIKATLLVAFPLTVGMMIFVAAMDLLGIGLNMFNIVVVPSIIGIGVDNAVHIYHRYRTEGPGSIRLVVRYTGAAALLASLTTGVGFGSSIVSHNQGLKSLGSLAVIGIVATFTAAVVFFPCFLSIIEGLKNKRQKG